MADVMRLPLLLLDIARGRTSQAQAQLASLEGLADSDDVEDQAALAVARTTLALWSSDAEAANAVAQAIIDRAVDILGPFTEGYRLLWPLAAEAALRAGHLDEVQAMLDATEHMPGDGIPPYIEAQVHRFRGLLAAAEDRHDQVEDDLRRAATMLEKLGYPYFRAQTQTDLAEWLQSQSRHTEAEDVLVDASSTLARLGARPALDRLEALPLSPAAPSGS